MAALNKHKAVLNRAAELIEQYGWLQGRFGKKEIGFCLLGAIGAAERELETHLNLTSIWKRTGPGLATTWNDKNGRTKEEVLTLLRELANEDQ